LDTKKTAMLVEKSMQSAGVSSRERVKFYKLAWDAGVGL
jgi:hypothetical protein